MQKNFYELKRGILLSAIKGVSEVKISSVEKVIYKNKTIILQNS